ncbi:hypothetical protein Tco_0170076 [Tanacetum coccineum]
MRAAQSQDQNETHVKTALLPACKSEILAQSKEAHALLAEQTKFLTPVAFHKHKGFPDFIGSLVPWSRLSYPLRLQEHEEWLLYKEPLAANVICRRSILKALRFAQTRFLAKSAEKSLPFFKTLKKCTKKSDFLWTEEAKAAFKQMKEHIAKLPMLTAPEEQEELIAYLAASNEAPILLWKDQRRKEKTTPQEKKSRSRHGRPCSWTGHLALTDADQE